MCGILGSIQKKVSPDWLKRCHKSLSLLNHRGPDNTGTAVLKLKNAKIFLGHKRLSIIDLTVKSNQPKRSKCGRYHLIFNGEIYNYLELGKDLNNYGVECDTTSDTDVLLTMLIRYGTTCLNSLEGMFAFCFIDIEKQLMILARDPFGIKPLFYKLCNEAIYFGSELNCLLDLGPSSSINMQSAYDYLTWNRYEHTKSTFIDNIERLSPAHFLTYDLNKLKILSIEQYWNPNIEPEFEGSLKDASEKYKKLFFNSLNLHLRSDVPVGIALSGGLDSSSILSSVKHLHPSSKLNTFSYIAEGNTYSEKEEIEILERKLNFKTHRIHIPNWNFEDDLENVINRQGEPFGTTSIYAQYKIFEKVKKEGVKVVLEGQGADESLAGYNGYPGSRLLSMFHNYDILNIIKYINNWLSYPNRNLQQFLREVLNTTLKTSSRQFIARFSGKSPTPYWLNNAEFKKAKINQSIPQLKRILDRTNGRFLSQTLRNALLSDGLAKLLRHGDRNSMAWSIESRLPFLNKKLVEFSLKLPENYLANINGSTKYILRDSMKDIVPLKVLNNRKKIGFQTNELDWLRKNKNYILHVINSNVEKHSLFNKPKLISLLNQTCDLRNEKFNYAVWRTLIFLLWKKNFKV
jgi:asparagine synthase (glutamine-hydrolysing)